MNANWIYSQPTNTSAGVYSGHNLKTRLAVATGICCSEELLIFIRESRKTRVSETAGYLTDKNVFLIRCGKCTLPSRHITCGPSDSLVHGKSAVRPTSRGNNVSGAPVLWAVNKLYWWWLYVGSPPDLNHFTIHSFWIIHYSPERPLLNIIIHRVFLAGLPTACVLKEKKTCVSQSASPLSLSLSLMSVVTKLSLCSNRLQTTKSENTECGSFCVRITTDGTMLN